MSSKYSFRKYIYPARWISYWHQIKEVLDLEPETVLEVGVGSELVADYLKNQEIKITTVDIDEKLKPDIVGNVLILPFSDNLFDVILCAEVLEHLPFDKFETALRELKRVSRKYVILSLPHFGHSIKFSFKIPFVKEKRLAIRLAFPIKHQFDGEHYWEIGERGYSSKKVKNIIKKHFKIRKEFIPFEHQYHRCFVLEK